MSLEKQMETLTQSINDLIGAVDANTKVIVALLGASAPDAVRGIPVPKVPEVEEPQTKVVEEADAEVVEEADAEVVYGIADLKKAFIKLVEVHGRNAMEEVLAAHGAKKLSDLSDKKYTDEKLGDVMSDIQAKMEA